MRKSFAERAMERAKRAGSRIVFAFDPVRNPYRRTEEKSKERSRIRVQVHDLLSELEGAIAGVKLGLPVILALGLDEVGRIVDSFRETYFFICDPKMADVGYVNKLVAEQVFGIGFDALIIHAFIGANEGIDKVVKLSEEMGRGVLAVCAMTHPGANEYMNKYSDELLALSASAGVDGFILPATFPAVITRARGKYPHAMIVSPGVGVQGAPFGSAIEAGADFEIVGRSIADAPSPAQKAREIKGAIGG